MAVPTYRKVSLAAGLASALAVVVGGLGVYGISRLASDTEWVNHTHDVRARIGAVSQHVQDAKGDIRGFLLTGDSTYLTRHVENVSAIEAAFRDALRLTVDNPEEQTRLNAVRALLTDREVAFQRTVALGAPSRRTDDVPQRLAIGEVLSARIDSVLDAADSTESRLLAQRIAHQSASERLFEIASAILIMVIIGLAATFRRSIHRDLAGRTKAEEALRASEGKFAGILDIAVDAIVTIDDREHIVHFNRGAEAIFGFSRDEVLGRPLEILLPKRHEHAHASHLHAFAASPDMSRRMGERRQIHGQRKNGEEFPAEASISKLMTANGWLFTAVLRDVSERVRREQHEHALVAASEQLAQSVDYEETLASVAALPVPSVGAWSVLVIVEEDEAGMTSLRRVAGRHPDPTLDAALQDWQARELDWDSPEAVIDVLQTGKIRRIDRVSNDWLEAHSAGPTDIAVARRLGLHSLLVVPLQSREVVIGAWCVGSSAEHVFDEMDEALAVTLAERAAMAVESARLLRRAQRATVSRDRVLGVVSHDLRNPLSAMSMFAHRLADESLEDDERRSIVENVQSSVEWMHRLMQDLLDVASIDAGRLSVELEPQSVEDIVETVRHMFADRSGSRSITLATEVRAGLPAVLADSARVVQALANLVGNALKFTPAGGVVTIGARAEGADAMLWVRDTGDGIPESELPHVFDRFWHARRNAKERGHGLGLAIVQGIVRAHGGRIWVDSAPGVGSTFWLTIPLVGSSQTPSLSLESRGVASSA